MSSRGEIKVMKHHGLLEKVPKSLSALPEKRSSSPPLFVNCGENDFSAPNINSLNRLGKQVLGIREEIDSADRKKEYREELYAYGREKFEVATEEENLEVLAPQVAKLNFGPDEEVFESLENLSVDEEKFFKDRKPFLKSLEGKVKEKKKEPKLEDYFTPWQGEEKLIYPDERDVRRDVDKKRDEAHKEFLEMLRSKEHRRQKREDALQRFQRLGFK